MVWWILFCSLCSYVVGLERGERDGGEVVGQDKREVGQHGKSQGDLRGNRGLSSGRNIGGNIRPFKPVTNGIIGPLVKPVPSP